MHSFWISALWTIIGLPLQKHCACLNRAIPVSVAHNEMLFFLTRRADDREKDGCGSRRSPGGSVPNPS